MFRRTVAAVLTAFLFLSAPARAQSDNGQIAITVVDATTKQPVSMARVLLEGPVISSELSGANGEVKFTEVPDGIYRARVAKSSYDSITSAPFEVVNGRYVSVAVSLALTSGLKVIGTVVAHSAVSVSSSTIGPDSAQRKLSNNLADALNKLSGVSVSTTSDDSDGTQTVSLEGHDASQTQLSLDGVPLNAPGSAGNLGAFATDLFGGASVRTGPQLGGLGGGVNFSTLQPTISWLSNFLMSVGSNGRNNYSFGESGSAGKLGIAAQTTYRANPSLVDGQTYLDASGLDYSHNGDANIYGNLVKLRYQFTAAQTLTGTFLNSTRSTNLVCLRVTSAVPCGYGPGNTSDGNVALYSLADSALVGETEVQATVYSSGFGNQLDESARYVDGAASPTGYSTDTRTRGFTLNATLPARERHTISLQSYGSWSDQTTSPLVPQANAYYNGAQSSKFAALQLTDSVRSNDKLTLTESFGVNGANNAQSSVLGSFGVQWRPTPVDAYGASYSAGGVAAAPGRTAILTDPASLRFDCNGNVAYGNAPGDQPGASSSTSARAGYARTLKGGNVSVQLYRQVQDGTVLPVQVNGTALVANGTISPSYLADVAQLYASAAGCSAPPGTRFSASQLYFSSPVGGVRRVYEGGSISGYFSLGNLVVQPYYNLNVSKAFSTDPRIDNPYSITISGSQLPNVPLQKAGVVLDYRSRRSSLEYLADAQYTGKNDPHNLPAYTTFDAGVSANLSTGTVTAAVSNLTNAYSGIFASPQNAVPYVTQSGVAIPTIARPLTPRTYSMTYAVKFGPGAQGSTQVAVPLAASAGGPEGPGGPGGPGRGFRGALSPLPSSPPAKPLDVADSPACASDPKATAQVLLSTMKSFVAQIEAAKTGGTYPAAMTAPEVPGATLTYHGLSSTYAISIVPKLGSAAGAPALASSTIGANRTNAPGAGNRGSSLRALVGCLPLHIAQSDDVTARHLYAAESGTFSLPQITFMPAVGLYFAPRAQQAGQESFRLYALPSSPPANPFEIRSAASSCSPGARALAATAMGRFAAYFAQNTPPAGWSVAPHQSKGGAWYSLVPDDPAVVPALLSCGRIAAVTPEDIVARGYDGLLPPAVNFARPLGLYVVRPQRPPLPSPSPAASP